MARSADQDLIARIAEHNSEALGLLYDRYGARIYTLSLQITGSAAAAEAIVQEVFARCWHSPGRFLDRDVSVSLIALAWRLTRHPPGEHELPPSLESAHDDSPPAARGEQL